MKAKVLNRKKIKNGSILQIPLLAKLGFAYAKFIDHKEMESRLDVELIRIYKFRNNEEHKDFNILIDQDLLISPIMVHELSSAISENHWKVVGSLPILKEDYFIPEFKMGMGTVENEKRIWYRAINGDDERILTTYDKVKHLEDCAYFGTTFIESRISMEFLRQEGKVIKDYFDLSNEDSAYQASFVESLPIYSKLPNNLKGRALK